MPCTGADTLTAPAIAARPTRPPRMRFCWVRLNTLQRWHYFPTATVLQELRGEGFEPFMVCQTRVRRADRRDFTKHMIRLRHASQVGARGEANKLILLNIRSPLSALPVGRREDLGWPRCHRLS
jgi:hypothetical protein